jgi:hypothetical protein
MPSKPALGTRKAEKFKDGQKKSGGAKAPPPLRPGSRQQDGAKT